MSQFISRLNLRLLFLDFHCGKVTQKVMKQRKNADQAVKTVLFFLVLSLTSVFISYLCISSFLQTHVPAAPVSMETAAVVRRWSWPTPASALKAMRGRGAIRSQQTCPPFTGTPPPPPLPSWPPPPPPPQQPPLSRHNQPQSPPPPRQHLLLCSHGNPNLGRGCWWCRGRQTG